MQALKHRKENKLDDLRKRKWDEFFPKCLPYYADGVDREGRLGKIISRVANVIN
jgi:hypothetical protein